MKNRKTVAVSGGFDPIHVGHVRMILAASRLGDVIVIINSDEWLSRKKGYVFMPWDERAEIIKSIVGVSKVVHATDDDETVCETLRDLKRDIDLDIFANGGDRIVTNTPEMNVCEKLGIEMVWNCGGEKIQSSSDLVNKRVWSQELPQLNMIDKKYEDKNVNVIAVSIDPVRDASRVRSYVRSRGYVFTTLHDYTTSIVLQYRPSKIIPFTVIIDRKGKIIYQKSGYASGDEQLYIDIIESMI
jgi:D-beta-D-heptose 7-phosphate kinase/D-beta-D-heptose 1-phosphate adenosyltransferase